VSRPLSVLLVLFATAWLAGCGGGDDLIDEGSLRDCLAQAGLGPKPTGEASASYAPVYLNTAPDFSAYTQDGARLDVVVQGNADKARRTAADVRGAMLPLGISNADERVLAEKNVVAVFDQTPSSEDRGAASSCLR
jgi:hypothetical protein